MQREQLAVDTLIIGGGVIGLAVARALAQKGQEVIVLEQGDRFGEGLSSRNSEVIHAGIYYPTDSLKARLCTAGRECLYTYCDQHQVRYRKLGKWIIATGSDQLAALDEVYRQGAANGVPLRQVEGATLRAALPEVTAAAALFSPETGIIDSHGLMLALLADLEASGGQLVCRAPVTGVESLAGAASGAGRHRIQVGGDLPCTVTARRVVNAAGLDAVPLARSWQGYPEDRCPGLWYARGVYFSYGGKHPFEQLVYPLPEPGGLGVHLTLDLAGQARFGPDVEWIEHPDFTVDPGRRDRFADAIRTWWPALEPHRLQPAYAGIRPKLKGPGEGFSDFHIQDERHHGVPGLVHLFGIESPGLTACLALADEVAARLE